MAKSPATKPNAREQPAAVWNLSQPYIGTAGWSIPRDAAASFPGEGAHLDRYARALNCAEINSTFYRPPRASTLLKWAAAVPATFRFSVKAPKTITHINSLSCAPEPLKAFLELASVLEAKLGPILFQLPPKLAFDAELAESFFELLRMLHAGPVALEPRHASWFTPEGAELLKRHRIARVAADPARVPEAAEPGGADDLVYFRLHGSPRTYYTPYTPQYLAALAARIARRPAGSELWVIFDNTASGAAIHNALALTAAAIP